MQKFRAVAKKMANNFRGYFFLPHTVYTHTSLTTEYCSEYIIYYTDLTNNF